MKDARLASRTPAWRSWVLWTGAGLAVVGVLGVIDYRTGPELAISIFYLLPVAVVAWKAGLVSGLFLSFVSAVVWFLAESWLKVPYSQAWIPYWNALVRLGFFLTTLVLIGKTRELADSLQARAISLAEQIKERERMQVLYGREKDILEMIAQGKPLWDVLSAVVQKVEVWSEGVFCAILVYDVDQRPLWYQASPGLIKVLGRHQSDENSQDAQDDPAEKSAAAFPDSESRVAETWLRETERALAAGFQLVYQAPVRSRMGEALGVLRIFALQPERLEPIRLQLFEKIAHVTTIALERQRSTEMLRRLSSLILSAQEAERRRLARELHDGISQMLASVAFRLQSIAERVPAEAVWVGQEVAKAKFLLQKAVREVRTISENLRPSELDELGLAAALRALCDDFRERCPLQLALLVPVEMERFSNELELAVYRIVQEGLRNVEKHAQASEVVVELNWDQEFVNLRVRDNGRGLAEPDALKPERQRVRMGLVDMRERCEFLGGSFVVRFQPDFGTEIAVRIPRNMGRGSRVS